MGECVCRGALACRIPRPPFDPASRFPVHKAGARCTWVCAREAAQLTVRLDLDLPSLRIHICSSGGSTVLEADACDGSVGLQLIEAAGGEAILLLSSTSSPPPQARCILRYVAVQTNATPAHTHTPNPHPLHPHTHAPSQQSVVAFRFASPEDAQSLSLLLSAALASCGSRPREAAGGAAAQRPGPPPQPPASHPPPALPTEDSIRRLIEVRLCGGLQLFTCALL